MKNSIMLPFSAMAEKDWADVSPVLKPMTTLKVINYGNHSTLVVAQSTEELTKAIDLLKIAGIKGTDRRGNPF